MLLKRILVVDDEEAILLALKKLLKRPNVLVDTAESADSAIFLLKQQTYNIVIADLRLSGTLGQEGFDIIEYVKKYSPDTIVALITAYGNTEIKDKALALGADFYYEKPISMKNLYEILESIGE